MSLIKKKYDQGETQLNQLKYAPNRGPLVQKRIPTGENPSAPASGQIQTRANDLTRIASLMTRKEGLGYLTNNTILNTSVAQSYTIKGTFKDKLKALNDVNRGKALLDTLGTLGSTLAQVPVAGTGTHFIKGKLFGKPDTSFNKPTKTTANRGDQGAAVVKYGRENYYDTLPNTADAVNGSLPYEATEPRDYNGSDDYIKFFFEVLRPGEQSNVFFHLRAYLDSFNDNYNSTWNSFNYVGRGEQFHTYQSFGRSIEVSFKSAVATKQELAPMYTKLAYLASTTAPSYNQPPAEGDFNAAGLMRGTIVRMSIGDYLSQTAGYISNITYGWESNYPFEIARGKKDRRAGSSPSINTDLETQQVPHILNVSLSFTPIHEFTPQTGLFHYITNPNNPDGNPFFNKPDENYRQGVELDVNIPL